MANQNWDYLLLKNGDKAYFTPLPPTSTIRGGILAEPATTADTQPVRIGTDGFLYTSIIRSSITVEVKTQDNVTVSGGTVVARENDANGDEIASAQYNGQPVTLDVPRNIHYYIEVVGTLANHFGPNTVSGIASSPSISHIITYQDASNITTYKGVVEAVRLGLNDTLIGKEIADTWTDEDGVVWDDPSIVVHVGNVMDPEGSIHVAAIMQRKYASSKTYVYDAPEQEAITETTALGDRFYYAQTYDTTWFYEGDITVGSSFPTVYKNLTYNDFYNKNSSSYSDNDFITEHGNSSYPYSAIRQCLNSEADKGAWWSSSHLGDSAPSDLNERHGYLKGCSTAMKEYLKPIQQVGYYYKPTYGDKTATNMELFTFADKIWLPSCREMSSSNATHPTEENNTEIFSYWNIIMEGQLNDAANNGRKFTTSSGSAAIIWLRSGYYSAATSNYRYCGVYQIGSTGSCRGTANASSVSCRIAPCFAIY